MNRVPEKLSDTMANFLEATEGDNISFAIRDTTTGETRLLSASKHILSAGSVYFAARKSSKREHS